MDAFVEDRSVLSRSAAPSEQTVRYGDLHDNIADVRFGKRSSEQRPLVIVIHGGFWRPQFDRMHTGPMCAAIADAGWTTASIEYRRVPGNPDATLRDVELALNKLPSSITRHAGRAIAVGHSAGGHLALWVAAKNPPALAGSIALGPAADLQWGEINNIGNGAVREFLGTSVSERRDVDPCQLPTPNCDVAIVQGIEDAIAPVAMAENYAARHAKTRLVKVRDCGHFGVIDPMSSAWPLVVEEIERMSQP